MLNFSYGYGIVEETRFRQLESGSFRSRPGGHRTNGIPEFLFHPSKYHSQYQKASLEVDVTHFEPYPCPLAGTVRVIGFNGHQNSHRISCHSVGRTSGPHLNFGSVSIAFPTDMDFHIFTSPSRQLGHPQAKVIVTGVRRPWAEILEWQNHTSVGNLTQPTSTSSANSCEFPPVWAAMVIRVLIYPETGD